METALFVSLFSLLTFANTSSFEHLKKGNQLFLESKEKSEVTKPIAVVVASSDLVISPERLFHTHPGELVVLQNLGPVIENDTLESLQSTLKEKEIHTVVLLANRNSKSSMDVIVNRMSQESPSLRHPILVSLMELESEKGSTFKSLSSSEKVDALTSRYLSNLSADLELILKGKEVRSALVSSTGKLDWVTSIKRRSDVPFGTGIPGPSNPSGL